MNIQAQFNQLLTLGAAAYRTSDLYKERQLDKQIAGSQKIQKKEYEDLEGNIDDIKADPKSFSTETALYRESATNAYKAAKAKYELRPNEANAEEYNNALQSHRSDAIMDAYSSLTNETEQIRNLQKALEERMNMLGGNK